MSQLHGKILFSFYNLLICIYVCLSVFIYLCASCMCQRLWKPEEGTGFPRPGVIGSGKPLDMGAGN